MPRAKLTLLLLTGLAPLVLFWALSQGSAALGWHDVFAGLFGRGGDVANEIVRNLRLPRALCAFAVGGMLALAGTLLQVLLRNPLADPYVLGLSGGAAVSALTTMLLGFTGVVIGAAAFAGALVATMLVFGLSHTGRGDGTSSRLLLTGVVMASGFGALVSLLLALAPGVRVQGMLFWLMGDLSYASSPVVALVVLGAGLALSVSLAGALNVLGRGERVAAALGENPAHLRGAIFFLASLLTAAAVALAGTIGFIGLIVPHMMRRLGATDHRFLLPVAALAGGILLTVADVLARTVVAPMQLPVGVLTALIGVPVFLYLMARSR